MEEISKGDKLCAACGGTCAGIEAWRGVARRGEAGQGKARIKAMLGRAWFGEDQG